MTRSFAVIATAANTEIAELRHRMPGDPETGGLASVARQARPGILAAPITGRNAPHLAGGSAIISPRNNGQELLEPNLTAQAVSEFRVNQQLEIASA
jgi:hypothetical protein